LIASINHGFSFFVRFLKYLAVQKNQPQTTAPAASRENSGGTTPPKPPHSVGVDKIYAPYVVVTRKIFKKVTQQFSPSETAKKRIKSGPFCGIVNSARK